MSKVDYVWEHDGTAYNIQARFLQMKEGRNRPIFYVSLMTGPDHPQLRILAHVNIGADGHFRPRLECGPIVSGLVTASELQAIAAFFDQISRDSELWRELVEAMEVKGLRYSR